MKIVLWARAFLAAFLLLSAHSVAFALDFSSQKQEFLWQPFPGNFPRGVAVYEGRAQSENGEPIRAWYADIDPKVVKLRAFLSTSATGKEATSLLAKPSGALLAVNGGYFDMQSKPARTFSVLRRNGQTFAQNIDRVTRRVGGGAAFFPIARSAVGWNEDGVLQFAWLWHDGATLRQVPAPFANAVNAPASPPTPEQIAAWPAWNVAHAIGGGPRLLENGAVRVSYDEEVFFGAGFSSNAPYPRTAIGKRADNRVILFVTDGKTPLLSVGLTLPELASEMAKLGCVDAMNLDGGGSSTFVAEGRALNVPSDGQERAVTSIFAVLPK
ncbi:MAG TPA: phosphodiester glycosidase family protein [Abditibacteriaceae bacterium]|jgi:exopolysaccharide biosynthesis protein